MSQARLIKWIDSASCHGWHSDDSLDNEALIISSIGWVVKEDKNAVTITTSVAPAGSVSNPLTIPKCAIKSMKRLPHRAHK